MAASAMRARRDMSLSLDTSRFYKCRVPLQM
jgi:hypothetical protein